MDLSNVFEYNQHFVAMMNVINTARLNAPESGHKHHIVPKCWFKLHNLPVDNSKDNQEVNRAAKRREKLVKQLKEARDYDAKIAHAALSRVEIDLDDGVKVNYEKVQRGPDGKSLGILAKI